MCLPSFSAKRKRPVFSSFDAEKVGGELVGFVEDDQVPAGGAELLLQFLVAGHLVEPDDELIVILERVAAR